MEFHGNHHQAFCLDDKERGETDLLYNLRSTPGMQRPEDMPLAECP